MNDNQSFERLIKVRTSGVNLLAKILLFILYTLVAVIGLWLCIMYAGANITVILLVGILDFLLIFFTWRFTCIEYEYSVMAGSFFVAKIFGKKNRREIYESELSRATFIAPYKEKYIKTADDCSPDKVIKAFSSSKASDIWFVIFEGEGEKKVLIFFEADEHTVSVLRKAAPRVLVRDRVSFTTSNNAKENDDNA